MKCFFTSDLHGDAKKYYTLFSYIKNEQPDAVFIGGDLLPIHAKGTEYISSFVQTNIIDKISILQKTYDLSTRFFLIMGNDDPFIYEQLFIEADRRGIIEYMHNRTVPFWNLFITGYNFIPPTPFQLKDWERYDISYYVDLGTIPLEQGKFTKDITIPELKERTIKEDLQKLANNAPIEKTIFLFHAPPYKTLLDRAALDGKMIDHAPVDVHIGSIAIKRFIEKQQPLITLHGHVHETTRITGSWKQQIGRTYLFSGAHDGSELSLVRFDTHQLNRAKRELIDTEKS